MAKEGLPLLIGTGLVCAICWLWFVGSKGWPAGVIAGFSSLLPLGMGYFFRDPERTPPEGDGVVVSAADGRVVKIQAVDGGFVGAGGTQVSVFLSVWDVHVNRAPLSGRVHRVEYRPGRFYAAFRDRASAENEQTVVALEGVRGRLIVKQIAGVLARRIVCRLNEGDQVRIGERFGLIQFGSRVDLILPAGAQLRVQVGDRARAGETIIGVLP